MASPSKGNAEKSSRFLGGNANLSLSESPSTGSDSPSNTVPVARSYAQTLQLAIKSNADEPTHSKTDTGNGLQVDTPWVPEQTGAHNDVWPPDPARKPALTQPEPQHPKAHYTSLKPGETHRSALNLDFDDLQFGSLVHIDWVKDQLWTDRPAIITGINRAARRVRVFPTYSFKDAGGIYKKFDTLKYRKDPAAKERDMRKYITLDNATSGATVAHYGTPVVRLSGGQLGKRCWIDTEIVKELPFDRVCKQSVGGTLVEASLSLDDMKILKTHTRFRKTSLFPSAGDGRLDRYDERWEGFQDYGKK